MANEPTTQTADLNDSDLAARTQAQAQAQLPQPKVKNPWEEEPELPAGPATSKLGQAYEHAKGFLSDLETHASENVIAPFRAGLDRMGEELQQAGESGHTATGGQLTGPTRALASGVGTLLKAAPIGNNVKDTALMALTPTLPEGHLFEGLRVIPSAPMAAEEAAALRQFTGKELASEDELNLARKTKAEYDANQALAKRKVDTDPKASVPSKNKNVSEMKSSSEGRSVSEQKPAARGSEPSSAMSEEEKADLRKSTGKDLQTEEDYTAARKSQAEWESNKALSAGKVDTDPKAAVPSKNKNVAKSGQSGKSPKDIIEGQGLKYKGELVPGSGVHMFEHPDHPGKTAALQEPLTHEAVQNKMHSKLGEFGVALKPMKFEDAKASAVKSLGKKPTFNRNYKTRDREQIKALPPSDKKTLTPDYLLKHENHFDPDVVTPEDMLEKKFGAKPVTTT